MPLNIVQLTDYAPAIGAGLAGGVLGTLAVRALAVRFGIVNKPNPLIPQHTKPVAYLGGVGVSIGVATGVAASAILGLDVPGLAVLLPGVLFLLLGVADDLFAFKPAPKFLLQAGVAALAVALGVRASITGVLLIDAAISWFWLSTLVNAFNFTDVCDGLLGSLSVVMFIGLAVLAPAHAGVCLIAAAACLGFLAFNRPPASIFLGDAGSHLLGFLAGAVSLLAAGEGAASPLSTLAAGALVVGVPLFEITFLTLVRMHKGLAWWRGSPDHFSLRLQAAGFSRGQTDLLACTAAVLWAAAGVVFVQTAWTGKVWLLVGACSLASLAAGYLLRHEVKRPAKPGATSAPSATAQPGGSAPVIQL